jgi:hypothetical protein
LEIAAVVEQGSMNILCRSYKEKAADSSCEQPDNKAAQGNELQLAHAILSLE